MITDDLNEILEKWAGDVVKRIQSNLSTTGTNASGRTSESLEYTVENGELTIYGRRYFEGVEIGRPAGRVPYRFGDIIYQWAKDKGIVSQFGSTDREQRSVSWAIAQFIKKNGTSLYRKGGREDIFTSVIDDELPKLEDMILVNVKDSILERINK